MGQGANTSHRGRAKLDWEGGKQVGRGHHDQLAFDKVALDGILYNHGTSLCISHAIRANMPPLLLRMILRKSFCWWKGKNIDHTHCHRTGVMVDTVSTSAPTEKIHPMIVGKNQPPQRMMMIWCCCGYFWDQTFHLPLSSSLYHWRTPQIKSPNARWFLLVLLLESGGNFLDFLWPCCWWFTEAQSCHGSFCCSSGFHSSQVYCSSMKTSPCWVASIKPSLKKLATWFFNLGVNWIS